jgi:hypothetical protein
VAVGGTGVGVRVGVAVGGTGVGVLVGVAVAVGVLVGVFVGPPGVIVGVGVVVVSTTFATKASLPRFNVKSGPIRTGKLTSVELVNPATYASPEASTAMPWPSSLPAPPI